MPARDPRPDERAEDASYRKGVGLMLLNRAGEVFVASRIDTPSDAWQMPQGGIDPGETPVEAAMRELEEEIGTAQAVIIGESRDWFRYDLPEPLRARLWGGRYRGQTQKWFLLRFTGEDADIDLDTDHPEFASWRWVRPSELPQLIVPFKRDIYVRVLAEFEPLLTATE
jgi:putative (di)nucleoside polyphosphate hydrolase